MVGFTLNSKGGLEPASALPEEFLRLQTDDTFRRRENRKSMQQILLETSGLAWKWQTYDLAVYSKDDMWAREFLTQKCPPENSVRVGLNIGSSLRHRAKRWPPKRFFELTTLCQKKHPDWTLIVLAGPEDVCAYDELERMCTDAQIANCVFSGHVHSVSKFIALVNQLPVVVSADTFGLHVAIGLNKSTVSLWGPQPKHETSHYGFGKKLSLDLKCAPCFAGMPDACSNRDVLRCMRDIMPESVLSALESELSS